MSILCSMVGASFVTAAAEVIRRKLGITAVGNAQVDTAQSKFGGSSALFDGTGDYLIVQSNPLTSTVVSGSFTIEFWFRFSSGSVLRPIWSLRDTGGTNRGVLYISSANTITWWNGGDNLNHASTLSANTWYHIACVKDGSIRRLLVDGANMVTDSNTQPTGDLFQIGRADYTSTAFTSEILGHIDEFRISNTARYTTTFTPSTTAFVNDANTLLLIHADGTDASTFIEDDNGVRASKALIAFGNAQIDTAQSQFGGSSLLLDGTGDYLFSPSNSDFGFGTGDFTLEGWFRFVNFTNGPALFDLRSAGGTEVKPLIYCGSDGVLYYYVNGAARITGSALSATTWYHITVSRASGSTKMFVNGTQVGSTYSDSNNYGTTVVSIGIASWNTAFNALNGHVDEIRVSNSARYTANFTTPTQPFVNDANTLLLIHADGTDASTVFRDDNGALANRQPKYITAVGNAQVDTAQSKFGGASALFDGTGDYLTVGNTVDADMALTGNNWTVEYWARINAHAGAYQGTLGIWDPNAGTASVWYVTTNAYNGTNKMGISYFYGTNSGSGDLSFGSALSTGVWQHHAFVRNGNTLTAYLDGVSQGTHDMTGRTIDITGYNSSSNTTLKMTVGALTGGAGAFNGHLDEIRISNTARYTAAFTPSTTPFQSDANTVLLIHADGADATTAFYDDTGSRTQKGIQAIPSAQVDTAQSKFGGSSLLISNDGASYLSVKHHGDFLTGTGSFCVEGWFRPLSTGNSPGARFFYFKGINSATGFGLGISTDGILFRGPSTTDLVYTGTISNSSFSHIAFVFNGTTKTIYLNGTSVASASASINVTDTSDIQIGYNNVTFGYNGHIDELRHSNTARYTANFTAPTATFQNDSNTLLLLHMDGTDASTVFFDDNGIAPYTP